MKRISDETNEKICDELLKCKESCETIALKLGVSTSTIARIKSILRHGMIEDPESYNLTSEELQYFRVWAPVEEVRNCDICQQPKISVQVYAHNRAVCDDCLIKAQQKTFDKVLANPEQTSQMLEHELRAESLSANEGMDSPI